MMEHELFEVEIGVDNDIGQMHEAWGTLDQCAGMTWQGRHICFLTSDQLERIVILQERIPRLSIKVNDFELTRVSIFPQEN